NYTKDVSVEIKNKYKNQARKLLNHIQEEIINQTEDLMMNYEKQLTHVETIAQQRKRQEDLQQAFTEKLNEIDEQMEKPVPNRNIMECMDQKLIEKTQMIEKVDGKEPVQQSISEKERPDMEEVKPRNGSQTIADITNSIDQTIATIEGLPGFQSLIEDLTIKKTNLNNRTLTIALFGAFSAGKSSFSNALIGEALLPSSPNPTTAVISRISPVTEAYKHGTVAIQLKDEQFLIRDILDITKELSPPSTDLAELIVWMKEQDIAQHSELNQMHQSYLQAMILG